MTYQSGHPGVTVMIISGLPEYIYRMATGFPTQLDPWNQLPMYYIPPNAIMAGLAPLVILISLGVCLAYSLLKVLFNEKIALIAAIFIALDPLYIYQSKILHLDATLTNLMMLSALTFLVFLKTEQRKYLLFSSILGGLALLTKMPAVFLIPYIGLSLLVKNFEKLRKKTAFATLLEAASPLILWLLIAGFLYFALFPALWVSPRITLQKLFQLGVKKPVLVPHEYQNYFLGKVYILKHVGLRFYLLTAIFYNTPVTIIFSVISAIYLFQKRILKADKIYALLIFLYSFFFFVMVSIAAKNGIRYLAPFFPMFAIFAAAGFYWFFKDADSLFKRSGHQKKLALVIPILLLTINFGPVLKKHPYYGTYFNPLFGGHKAADYVFSVGDQAEGVREALNFINEREDEKKLRIGCHTPFACIQHTKAKVFDINEKDVDYLVFLRNKVIRESGKEVWDKYKDRAPEKIVSFEGIPYAWVYESTMNSRP